MAPRSEPVLEYACPGCGTRYNTLQAAYLIDFTDGQFHCEACSTVLTSVEEASGGAKSGGAGGEGARQERLKATKALQVQKSLFCLLLIEPCLQFCMAD